MRIETYLWILIGLLIFIALIGIVFILKDKEKLGKRILKISGWTIFLIYFTLLNSPKTNNYNLYSEQELWEEYDLPQIDSCMYLEFQTKDFLSYRNWGNDSISHYSKWIRYDIFDIYSIEDKFINKKESKTLKYCFIKPNLFRKSSMIVLLNNDTITKIEGDVILKNWGIYERTYKKYFNN